MRSRDQASTIGYSRARAIKALAVARGERRAPRIQGRPDTDGARLPTADEREELARELGIPAW